MDGSPKGVILVVDDMPENLKIVSTILSDYNYDVRTALDGNKALNYAFKTPPDLILLDVRMPNIDGFSVCEKLKNDERTRDIPVIFLSALNDSAHKVRGFELGCMDFISKPFESAELLARVDTHVQMRKMKKQLEEQNQSLKESAKLRNEVEHIVYHDLRGPLSPIISFPKMIRKAGPLNDKQKKFLEVLENAGFMIRKLVNFTTDLHRMEKGTFEYSPIPVDLVNIIRNIIESLGQTAKRSSVTFDTRLNGANLVPSDAFFMTGEDFLCYTMLENLVVNALEASKVNQKITINIKTVDKIEIEIHNQAAIPDEVKDRFFEKYITHGKRQGTGLGTYSAKLSAETLGGSLDFKTSNEEGTSLFVRFPEELTWNASQSSLMRPLAN